MGDVTFRDFAGAIMGGDIAQAGAVLEELLALAPGAARAASEHFQARMASGDPAFMQKAMGLRHAVTGGDDAAIVSLLADCFGLDAAALPGALAALRARYPTPG